MGRVCPMTHGRSAKRCYNHIPRGFCLMRKKGEGEKKSRPGVSSDLKARASSRANTPQHSSTFRLSFLLTPQLPPLLGLQRQRQTQTGLEPQVH